MVRVLLKGSNRSSRSETADTEAAGRGLTDVFLQRLRTKPLRKRSTVFVSHQRENASWAERAAWEASEVGLDYWLDVHDPGLKRANAFTAPAAVKSPLIARSLRWPCSIALTWFQCKRSKPRVARGAV